MKTVVILQSNYIPWKGYFDLMHEADEFILYDCRQYTRQDWRNRNQVKGADGPQWLSIPVIGKFGQRINETAIANPAWASSHWKTLVQQYRKAPYFKTYADQIEALYRAAADEQMLSKVNWIFLQGIGTMLGINTKLRWSSEFPNVEGKSEALVALIKAVGGSRYVSGPAARSYIAPDLFERADIDLSFKDYDGYPEYPQLYPPFAHGVTVLDLLFNAGPETPWFIWGWRE